MSKMVTNNLQDKFVEVLGRHRCFSGYLPTAIGLGMKWVNTKTNMGYNISTGRGNLKTEYISVTL